MRLCIARLRALGALALISFSLTACASLGGSPERIVSVQDSVNLVSGDTAPYRMQHALEAFDSSNAGSDGPRHGQTRRQYRDTVVTLYLNAADAIYSEWRSRVSDERRELGLGFDSTVIALTGIASVARESLVRSLTATASIMAGTRGAIDRNVYFDRTLPGLLATMDAERLRLRADILRRLLSDDEAAYPLALAFSDISNYELAASLDRAIEQVTAQAAAERAAAQQEYDAAIHACHSTEDVSANRRTIFLWAEDSKRTEADLRSLAASMGADTSSAANLSAWRERIYNRLEEHYCTNAALADLIAHPPIRNPGG